MYKKTVNLLVLLFISIPLLASCDKTSNEPTKPTNYYEVIFSDRDEEFMDIDVVPEGGSAKCEDDFFLYPEIKNDQIDIVVGWDKELDNVKESFTTYPITKSVPIVYDDNFMYALNQDEQSYSVYGYIGTENSDVTIPETLNSLPVTSISYANNTKYHHIGKLTISKNIVTIDRILPFSYDSIEVDKDNKYFTIDDNVLFNKDKTILYSTLLEMEGEYVVPNSVEEIAYKAFSGDDLTKIVLPDSLKTIGSYVFDSTFYLKEITIPKNVKTIGEYAFNYCYNLETINVDSQNKYYQAEDNILFNKNQTELIFSINSNSGKYEIPSSVKKIHDFAFYCADYEEIIIPSSVKEIGKGAFSNCTKLKSIEIQGNIQYIGTQTFDYCEELESVVIPNSVKFIGAYAFSETALLEIELPEELVEIGQMAFYSTEINNVDIPKNVKKLYSNSFAACPIESYNVDPLNTYYSSINGMLLTDNNTKLILFPSSPTEDFYTIPESVTTITTGAIKLDYDSPTSIIIPKSVEVIEESAFIGIPNFAFTMQNKILYLFIENEVKPSGWNDNWCKDCKLYWGGGWKYNSNGNPQPK